MVLRQVLRYVNFGNDCSSDVELIKALKLNGNLANIPIELIFQVRSKLENGFGRKNEVLHQSIAAEDILRLSSLEKESK